MRHSFERKQAVAIAAIVGLLCGCNQSVNQAGQSTGGAEQSGSSSGQSGKPAASQGSKADFQVEPLAKSGASTANWGSDKGEQPKAPTFQRGRLLARDHGGGGAGGGGGSAPVDPYVARYSKFRLEQAAVVKNYAHVSVMPVGIDAFVKTAWTSGNVHVRLALLGPLNNLKTFNETQQSVKLTFQDRVGNPVQVMIVPMTDMKEVQGINYGTPTYAVEGSMECPLELYEQYYQWMFEWE